MPGPADERTVHPRGRDPYLAREQSIIGKVSTIRGEAQGRLYGPDWGTCHSSLGPAPVRVPSRLLSTERRDPIMSRLTRRIALTAVLPL